MNAIWKHGFLPSKTTLKVIYGSLLSLVLLIGGEARAWNVIDLADGTNYINSTLNNTNYFASYQITNNSGAAYTNIWIKLGSFTNGATSNIGLAGGSLNKKSIGILAANQASSFYFFMSGASAATSATNSIGVYVGDPDASGMLLTNILFTKNWLIPVSQAANGGSAGTTYLSTTNPILGGYLVMTSTFTIGNSVKAGLYACYPAVSNNWDASTFAMVSNTVYCDGVTYPDKMVFNQATKPSNLNMTNIATFRVINVKPSSTGISPGGFVNTAGGGAPDYIAPSSIVNYGAAIIAGIPASTNSLVLTNYASVASAYTNTTVYFTNKFVNSGGENATVASLTCVLPAGFVYSGSATFNGAAIASPATNAPSATNYTVAFSEGYPVPANSSALLIFAAAPTNALDAAGSVTNRSVLTTYTSYGIIGTNQVDKTFATTDDAKPTASITVLLNPTATNDAYSVNENAVLTVAAPGVLSNDNEPNGFAKTVVTALTVTPSHGALTLNADGSFTYTPTAYYNGSDSFTYTMTNGNARASTATVSLTANFVNYPPTLAVISPLTITVNASQQTVNLSGIASSATASAAGSATLESGQSLSVTSTSSNPSLISNPTVTYTSANTTGSLAFTPVAHQTGSSIITVIVQDSGGVANGGVDSVTNTFTVTVNKLTPTVTVNGGSYTYNGLAQGPNAVTTASTGAVTWSYVGVSGTTYGPSSTRPTGAGSYTATATVATDADYYSASSSATAFTLAKATLTVTPNAVSTTYNGTTLNNPAYSDNTANYSITGFQNSETVSSAGVTLSGSMAFNSSTSTAVKDVGAYTQAVGTLALAASNYSMSFANPTPNSYGITPKALTVSGIAAASTIYDGTTTAKLGGAAAFPSTEAAGAGSTGDGKPYSVDSVSPGGTAAGTLAAKDVGTQNVTITGVTVTGPGNGNYTVTPQPGLTQQVTAKALTAQGTLSISSKVYDGTTGATPSGAAALLGTESAGAGSTGDSKPYSVDSVSLTGTASYAYNSKDVASATTVTESGLSLTGTGYGNYTLTAPTLSAGITPKALTVSGITAASTIYDGTTTAKLGGAAAFPSTEAAGAGSTGDGKPYSVDSVSPGGTAAGTLAAKDVGTQNVTITGVTVTGPGNGNYTVTPQPGLTQQVTAKALTVAGATVTSKVYDGTTDATITGAALQTAEAAGSGSTGDGKPYTGDTVTLGNAATGTFADSSIGDGKSVTTTMNLSGGQAANYSLTPPTLMGDITPNLPVADAAIYYRAKDVSLKISITNLIARHTSQPQGHPVSLVGVAGGWLTNNTVIAATTNGTAVYMANPYKGSAYIVLAPTNNLNESFAYVVSDATYPTLMATNLITIAVTNGVGQLSGQINITNSLLATTWAGIPGLPYDVQRNTNLASGSGWVTIWTTNAPVAGVFNFTDSFTDLGSPPDSAYYRLRQN